MLALQLTRNLYLDSVQGIFGIPSKGPLIGGAHCETHIRFETWKTLISGGGTDSGL